LADRHSPAALRDREAAEGEAHPVLAIDPAAVRARSKSLEVLIPVLYRRAPQRRLRGSAAAPVGQDASGLSASTIARLKQVWSEEHGAGRSAICHQALRPIAGRRHHWSPVRTSGSASWSLSARRRKARRNSSASPMVARESQSWRDLLLDLKRRG